MREHDAASRKIPHPVPGKKNGPAMLWQDRE